MSTLELVALVILVFWLALALDRSRAWPSELRLEEDAVPPDRAAAGPASLSFSAGKQAWRAIGRGGRGLCPCAAQPARGGGRPGGGARGADRRRLDPASGRGAIRRDDHDLGLASSERSGGALERPQLRR